MLLVEPWLIKQVQEIITYKWKVPIATNQMAHLVDSHLNFLISEMLEAVCWIFTPTKLVCWIGHWIFPFCFRRCNCSFRKHGVLSSTTPTSPAIILKYTVYKLDINCNLKGISFRSWLNCFSAVSEHASA